MIEFLKIIAFSVFAAVTYGIIHDMFTAHICVEYFTIAHPPVFDTQSPFLLALGWGVIATWWVGLPLGLVLALVARIGSRPVQDFADVRPRIIGLMLFSGAAAALSGTTASVLYANGSIGVPGGWADAIPPDSYRAFTSVAYAHLASYAVGAIGGLAVIGWTVRRRFTPGDRTDLAAAS